ncbi:MAG: hypothetical protein KAR35_04240 [Candidatus Heimdallarchaeota archaeon]|nr:hypothetical protein [Candidatus Heimdallarchaeota archaeon]MCK5048564.1 hypothetical protein [Candidatus Heimdallarchaeota archaeon]
MSKIERKRSILLISIVVSILVIIPLLVLEPSLARGDIVDITGVDGCKYVLITDGDTLEIVDYDGPEKKDVLVGYYSIHRLSICMVGPMIRILFVI